MHVGRGSVWARATERVRQTKLKAIMIGRGGLNWYSCVVYECRLDLWGPSAQDGTFYTSGVFYFPKRR